MNRRIFCASLVGLTGVLIANCANPSRSAYLEVDQRLCIGCGECVKVCKGDAVEVLDNKAFIDPTKCIQCSNCVKVCPYDAII